MADEIKVPEAETQPKETPKTTESVDKEWQTITEGKYNSPTEVAKAYKDLEKKYGEQSTEVQQAREFMTVVYPLLDEIKNDPELFKALDEKLKKKNLPSTTPTKADAKEEDNSQSEVRSVASDLILSKFEEKHGINELDPEERRKLRKNIGDAIYELTGNDLNHVDLRRLSGTLENAYILQKYKSKSETHEGDEGEERASISSVPSKGGKSETVLTPEEAHVAERMGLTRDQYVEGKKTLTKK